VARYLEKTIAEVLSKIQVGEIAKSAFNLIKISNDIYAAADILLEAARRQLAVVATLPKDIESYVGDATKRYIEDKAVGHVKMLARHVVRLGDEMLNIRQGVDEAENLHEASIKVEDAMMKVSDKLSKLAQLLNMAMTAIFEAPPFLTGVTVYHDGKPVSPEDFVESILDVITVLQSIEEKLSVEVVHLEEMYTKTMAVDVKMALQKKEALASARGKMLSRKEKFEATTKTPAEITHFLEVELSEYLTNFAEMMYIKNPRETSCLWSLKDIEITVNVYGSTEQGVEAYCSQQV
jgi:hypothetical protein